MANENDRPNVHVSNWTLATRTEPGMRHVYPVIELRDKHGFEIRPCSPLAGSVEGLFP